MDEGGQVDRVAGCRLLRAADDWAFAKANAAAIEALWHDRLAANPAYFNGVVHVMSRAGCRIDAGVFSASLVATDFKSFMYWREGGFAPCGVLDAFGSAIVRSAEGHVLLGRQRAGNINAGLAYLPGGFIDDRDVAIDGTIDMGASIARELVEETGLAGSEVQAVPGFLITRIGHQVSMAQEFKSGLAAEDLRALILSRIGGDGEAELIDMVIVRSLADLAGANVPAYTALVLGHVFAE